MHTIRIDRTKLCLRKFYDFTNYTGMLWTKIEFLALKNLYPFSSKMEIKKLQIERRKTHQLSTKFQEDLETLETKD